MKVGFYLSNGKLSDVDLSHPEKGNPGIGGTEYQFICLPYYIDKYYPSAVEFSFYAQDDNFLPSIVRGNKASDIEEAYELAIEDGCDILVWRPIVAPETLAFIERLNATKESIKIIVWVHNTLPSSYLNAISTCASIKRFVAVSDEQLDIIRDESIIYKGCVIVNGLDSSIYKSSVANIIDKDMVVYVGAMIPAKGFGMLARVWKRVLDRNKDARLYVIGSGVLYDRKQVLGKWNVADELFESKSIRPYLSDDSGGVHPSVKFLGTLGVEKIEYMSKACVGVVNPTALTENCPGSALEFQALGTPVVSGADWGLLDTVVHGETGLLGKTDEDLIENILYFMSNNDKSHSFGQSGIEFVQREFSYAEVTKKWVQLFRDVIADERNSVKPIYKNFSYKKKWLREVIRLAKADLYSKADVELTNVTDEGCDGDASLEPRDIYHDRVVCRLLKQDIYHDRVVCRLLKQVNAIKNKYEHVNSQLNKTYSFRLRKFKNVIVGWLNKAWQKL